MSKGGPRNGAGRPRLHYDAGGVDRRVTAQFLLTPETNDMLELMASALQLNRSALIRKLIAEAALKMGEGV